MLAFRLRQLASTSVLHVPQDAMRARQAWSEGRLADSSQSLVRIAYPPDIAWNSD